MKKPVLSVFASALLCAAPAKAETVRASWYGGGEYLSRHTASGERFNASAFTAAHRSLAFGTRLRVCHIRCVVVRVNDRGPYAHGRSLDLSRAAARAIGLSGVGVVSITRL